MINPVIADLALILGLAALITILFKVLKQPVVLGYILAGFLCSGNFLLKGVVDVDHIHSWAEIGLIFLLFNLGLEFNLKKLANVGGSALITVIVIVVGMMCTGIMVGQAMGWTFTESVYLGGMLSMSSTTIIIKAFDDLGMKNLKFTTLVFGVLVLEDVFAIILMVLLSTLFIHKSVDTAMIGEQVFRLIFFLVLWFLAAAYLVPSFLKKIKKYLNSETLLIVSLSLCLAMVVLANYAGFSSALGAFIMGSVIAGTSRAESIEKITAPVKDLFGAIFFVSVGMLVKPEIIVEYWVPILILTGVVILGQMLYGTLGFLFAGQGLRISLQSSLALTQIGEFAFILAATGVILGIVRPFLYPVAVAISVITIFTTPFVMRLSNPLYRTLSAWLPDRTTRILGHYNSGMQASNYSREWVHLLKLSLLLIAIYSILLGGIAWASHHYLAPLFQRIHPGFWGRLWTVSITILAMTPLLWALTMHRVGKKTFRKLWSEHGINHGMLVSLIFLRIFIAGMFLFTVLTHLDSIKGIVFVLSIFILCILLLWGKIKKSILHFENQIFSNLNEKELSTLIHFEEQRARYIHLAKMLVSPDSALVGKSFAESHLRSQYGVTVIAIVRGSQHMKLPKREMMLLPGDRISVVGTEEKLKAFAEAVEVPLLEPEYEDVRLKLLPIDEASGLIGKTITQFLEIYPEDCLVLGIERDNGSYIEPSKSVCFEANDVVWVASDTEVKEFLATACSSTSQNTVDI